MRESLLLAIKNDEKLKTLFICDLGLSNRNQDDFVKILTELRKKKVSVTYIDHHDLDKKILKQLEPALVKIKPL